MKFIYETFLWMGITFRDKSNESSSAIIGYSSATVTVPNHLLLARSNASLVTAHATIL